MLKKYLNLAAQEIKEEKLGKKGTEYAAHIQGVDLKTMTREYLEFARWGADSKVPGDESLRKPGMGFLIDDI